MIQMRCDLNMLRFVVMLCFLSPLTTSQSNEEACTGQTTINYIYGQDSVPVGPPVTSAHLQQGRPGKSGPPGAKGEKGIRGESGVPDNSELESLKRELRLLKQELQEKQTLPRTCDFIADGEGNSGQYLISPFPGFIQPFFVYCNFDGVARPQTIFNHDSLLEMATASCESNFCYKRKVNYKASLKQIVAAMNLSTDCQQFIKLRCVGVLFNHQSGGRANTWISRDGKRQEYWGGATSKRPGYCACGETGTCVDRARLCNCDKNAPPETSDEGYLTDKEALPVTELQFGDAGDGGEKAWHTLGPLVCSGRDV